MAKTPVAETVDESIQVYVGWFEDSETNTQDERRDAERDRDYYDNIQWTAEEIDALNKRKQPVITINRIKRKVDFLRGVESQQRTDPKAFPRNPQDEASAHAATDALRYVADANQYDVTRSKVWEELLIEGIGGVEVIAEQKGGDVDIVIRRIPWDRYFRDPHSRMADFSDARYHGLVVWMDREEALEYWPDADSILDSTLNDTSQSDTYDDKPRWQIWADRKRKRVRIVQIWVREGKGWKYCIFCKGGKLEGGPSPYRDEDGNGECPLVMQSSYVNRQNQRYGVVREMIGPQDEINKRRSKALHLISTRQTFGTRSAVTDVDAAKKEMAKPDGHLEIESGEFGKDFGVLPTGDMAAAQFQLLQEAKAEIDMMGPNASMQGKSTADQSGRAIIAQQQGGYIELGPMLDHLRQWNIRVYKQVWNRIRQFWTGEKWIRITDDERNLRFVGLNKPVTAGEEMLRQLQERGASPEDLAQAQQMIAMDPRAQQVIGTENNVTEMTVDIIVDDAPDSVTIQHEQFQQIVELVKSVIPIPPDVVIEASQLSNKDQLLEKMRSMQQQGPDPKAVALQAQTEAKIAQTQAQVQAKGAELQMKAQLAEREAQRDDARFAMEMQQDQARFEQDMAQDDMKFRADVRQRALMGQMAARQRVQPAI